MLIASTDPIWVKITDFGLSKREKNTVLRTNCGTSGYIAPELIGLLPQTSSRISYARAVDIWSLGIMVHEILTSQIPFLQTDLDPMSESGFESELAPPEVDMAQLYEYCHGYREFPIESLQNSQVSKDGKDFVMGLLVANPSARMSATDALKSLWLLDRSQEIGGELQTSQTDLAVPAATQFYSDTEDGPDYESDPDHDSSVGQSVFPTNQTDDFIIDPTPEQILSRLSQFVNRKRLGYFFPDNSYIAPYIEQAERTYKALKSAGCSLSMAHELTVLALYDLVILVGTYQPLLCCSCAGVLLPNR